MAEQSGAGLGRDRVTWLPPVPDEVAGYHDGIEERFRVGEVEFGASQGIGSTADRFLIRKHRPLVEAYLDVLTQQPSPNVVEVGLADGGSTALAALATEPARYVGLELDTRPLGGLTQLLERLELSDRFRLHLGVDQADRRRLASIVDAEFGDEALDVVIDDASHLLEPTRATFETLFPRLRPGGSYLIEDWNWDHRTSERYLSPAHRAEVLASLPAEPAEREAQLRSTTPLSILVLELVLAAARGDDVIASIDIGPWAVLVRRGATPIDRTFRLDDQVRDDLRLHPRQPGLGSVLPVPDIAATGPGTSR